MIVVDHLTDFFGLRVETIIADTGKGLIAINYCKYPSDNNDEYLLEVYNTVRYENTCTYVLEGMIFQSYAFSDLIKNTDFRNSYLETELLEGKMLRYVERILGEMAIIE